MDDLNEIPSLKALWEEYEANRNFLRDSLARLAQGHIAVQEALTGPLAELDSQFANWQLHFGQYLRDIAEAQEKLMGRIWGIED